MARTLRILTINLAVLLLLLAAVEGAVRLAVPEVRPNGTDRRLLADSVYGATPGLRPHAEGTSNGARFRVNGQGFWHYTAGIAPGRPGWLLLGDSVTMGPGVDPDSTFAGRLAARLDTLNVLNPSLIGYDVHDYGAVLRTLLARDDLNLHRVTVFWCLNDAYAPATTDPNAGVRRLAGPVLTFLRRHVRTYAWLKAHLADRPRTYFEHDRRLYDGPALEAALAGLDTLHRLADTRGLRLEIVLLPYEYQLRRAGEPGLFHPQDVLKKHLRDIPVYDAAPFLLAHTRKPETLYLYGDGIHFSERGHALLARFLETIP
ncbi:SGNH/GDSL hydrolase family protein [Rhodocaloribacter litoris]|uniref:SGNH/GDSL hydrolase family protein n=1 Tax=Rhodocaloribacter litoris TaxID=2558931 RepID=UPI00141DA5D1|nr:SGNH/GDSL hydrolase family protein [Rhodocaloribacter litoris]QXD14236.1 SGNH/GDSL hydrolase family protein [Rhodocaloribacter litoris]